MSRLPPGPRLSAVQRVRYLKNPYRFFRGCRDRYGDVFTVTTTAKSAVTGHPDGVKAIFTAPPDQFLIRLPAAQKMILGSASLTNFSGEPHRRERRLLAPPLQGNRMRALGPLMRAAADRVIDGWKPGETVVAHDAAMGVALDVILRAVFGAIDDSEREKLAAAVRGFVHGFSHPLWLMTALFGLPAPPVGPWAKFKKAKADLDALVFG
ncbi:MAG: cytochrome P450, partial [Fimbriiglobus sp.]